MRRPSGATTVRRGGRLTAAGQARLQGALIEALDEDRSFEEANGKLIYAADVAVVLFLADPLPHALPKTDPDNPRLMGFAAIFEDDPIEPAQILAKALADFLIDELSPDTPLLIPAPLDAQVFSRIERIVKDVATNSGATRHTARLLKQLKASTELDDNVEVVATQLMRLTLLRWSTNVLEGLRKLIDQRRVAVAATIGNELDEPLRTALTLNLDDGRGRFDRIMTSSLWRQALGQLARGRSMSYIAPKADALARLEIWNRRLEALARRRPDGQKARIVFLTGDAALLEPRASRRKGSERSEQEDFLVHHARHPRGFLPRLSLLQDVRSSESASPLGNELAVGALRHTGSHFLDLWTSWKADATESEQAEIAEDIKARWHELLRKASLRYRLPVDTGNVTPEWQTVAEDITKWQETLKDQIEQRFDKFWQECFYFATQGLVVFGKSADYARNSRNAPPIFLVAWGKTASFIDRLMAWTTPDKFDISAYRQGIEEMREDFRSTSITIEGKDETDYFYAYYLCHAAMFAGRGEWLTAAKVAAHAGSKVRSSGRSPQGGNGREALYLEAFCLRHAARRSQDLQGLESLLDRAEQIAQEETDWSDQNKLRFGDCVAIRFRAERLAIKLSGWLFARFGGENGKNLAEPFITLCSEAKVLLTEVERQCEDALTTANVPTSSDEDQRRVVALYKLRVRVLVNGLGLPFCAPKEVAVPPETERELFERAEKLKGELVNNFPAWGGQALSPFGEWVFNCAKARVADSREDRNEAKRNVLAMTTEDKLPALITFPYDSGRLRVMREAALRGD